MSQVIDNFCVLQLQSATSALAYVTLWQAQGARVEKDEEAFPKSLYFLRDFPDSAKQLST